MSELRIMLQGVVSHVERNRRDEPEYIRVRRERKDMIVEAIKSFGGRAAQFEIIKKTKLTRNVLNYLLEDLLSERRIKDLGYFPMDGGGMCRKYRIVGGQ